MDRRTFKITVKVIVILAILVGAVIWGLQKRAAESSARDVTFDFQYNTYIDKWCEEELPLALNTSRANGKICGLEIFYGGTMESGEFQIELYDENHTLIYEDTIELPGEYDKKVYFDYTADTGWLVYRFKEGSKGSFKVGQTRYVYNWDYYF